MTSLLTRILGRLPIGWIQLWHNKARLIAAVGGITFANILIFMQLGFMGALFETSVMFHRTWKTDVVIASSDFRSLPQANTLPRSRMYQALSVDGVAAVVPVYLGTIGWTDSESRETTNFRVMGVPPEADVFLDEQLQSQLPLISQPDTAIVDNKTRKLNPTVADSIQRDGVYRIELANRRMDLIGKFSLGASFGTDGTIVVSDQTFFRMFRKRKPGTPTLLFVRCESNANPVDVAARIGDVLPENDTMAFTKSGFIKAEQDYQASQTPIGFVFSFGVVIGAIVGTVVVYQVLTTDVQDHLSDYATFKAVGYSQPFFLGIIFEQAISLATLGFIPGLCVALLLYALAANAISLPIAMPWSRPLWVFLLTVVTCVLSGAISTRRLKTADPAELF